MSFFRGILLGIGGIFGEFFWGSRVLGGEVIFCEGEFFFLGNLKSIGARKEVRTIERKRFNHRNREGY